MSRLNYSIRRAGIRTIVRGLYDLQKLRIQMGNRIVAQFKAKLGQEPSQTEEETIDADGKKILADLRADFRKMMDGVKRVKLATFKASQLISDFTEFVLLQEYLELEESEKRHSANIESIVQGFAIYSDFLAGVKGCGPLMSGVILSEFDIYRAEYASSLIMYAGLDVAPDGRGRSKRAEHLVERDYTNKEGKPAKRMGITYNPFLKTKLVGVLGSSMLKAGLVTVKTAKKDENGEIELDADGDPVMEKSKDADGGSVYDREKCSKYARIYVDYRHRLNHRPDWADKTKGHKHNASVRYMIRIFLIDLYAAWKKSEGLTAHPPYHEAKLGLKHAG